MENHTHFRPRRPTHFRRELAPRRPATASPLPLQAPAAASSFPNRRHEQTAAARTGRVSSLVSPTRRCCMLLLLLVAAGRFVAGNLKSSAVVSPMSSCGFSRDFDPIWLQLPPSWQIGRGFRLWLTSGAADLSPASSNLPWRSLTKGNFRGFY
jgi:hypothetical protein